MDTSPRLQLFVPELPKIAAGLVARSLTVAVAESCTGGLLCAVLTSFPGSSDFFQGGIIAYTDSCKETLVGVPAAVIERYGAVSRETAEALATGVLSAMGTSIGIGITGYAGSDPDTGDPRDGEIHVALADTSGGRTSLSWRVVTRNQGRESNRAAAVKAALALLAESAGISPVGSSGSNSVG